VAELALSIFQENAKLVLFFCSPDYDLDALGCELGQAFPGPLVGCTSAGQIGLGGFSRGGILGLSLEGELDAQVYPILDLERCESEAALIGSASADRLKADRRSAFGLVLVDGLSKLEERLTAALYQSLGHVPMVGGSAGDDLAFRRTHVFVDGAFRSHAAAFVLFQTALPVVTFKFAHFVPGPTRVVITDSFPAQRLIKEINGEVAVVAYARAAGVDVGDLDERTFSAHPLVLEMGGEHYLRSVQRANPDGSLTLYCAIEDGVVLRVGHTVSPLETARAALEKVSQEVGGAQLIIGCDCIQRRQEYERSGLLDQMGAIMAGHGVFGFSTYGEQYNAVHVNQTFTGVALGR
jgi:hypothetical protein